jgi:hypothetical protein
MVVCVCYISPGSAADRPGSCAACPNPSAGIRLALVPGSFVKVLVVMWFRLLWLGPYALRGYLGFVGHNKYTPDPEFVKRVIECRHGQKPQ